MPRAGGTKSYFRFIGGKNSDSSPLASTENTAKEMVNVNISPDGIIGRRAGLDYEDSYIFSSDTYTEEELRANRVEIFDWPTARGEPTLNYTVVRVGNTMYFYNITAGVVSLSNGLGNQLDISSQATNVFSSRGRPMTCAAGKGALFCCGFGYNPFYIESVAGTGLVIRPIDIRKRDFEGIDDGLAVDSRPSSLSNSHRYNLLNQGWLPTYYSLGSNYASNADIMSMGFKVNSDGDKVFDSAELGVNQIGNSPAPKGHYILDAFLEDRGAQSSVYGLDSTNPLNKPRTLGFYAGRVWYASIGNDLFFSQLLTRLEVAGDCFQVQDPTAEELNELLPTDGGVIPLPEAGEVVSMYALRNILIIFGTNGIWQVSGGAENFSATTAEVSKVSSVRLASPESIVEVEDTLIFWATEGIYAFVPDKISGNLNVESISLNRINNAYGAIPQGSKVLSQGVYDQIAKRVFWFYDEDNKSDTGNWEHANNAVLVYDVTLNAFYDYTMAAPVGDTSSPFAVAGAKVRSARTIATTEDVTVNDVTVTADAEDVTTGVATVRVENTDLKVLTMHHNGSTSQLTFSEFCDARFKDWYTYDSTGVNYTSVVETNPETLGDAMHDKQGIYVYSYFDDTLGSAYTIEDEPV